jgi:hypothetical protein
VGIPTFDSTNGRLMEGPGGCSLIEFRMRDWQRLSILSERKKRRRKRGRLAPQKPLFCDRTSHCSLSFRLVELALMKNKSLPGAESLVNH